MEKSTFTCQLKLSIINNIKQIQCLSFAWKIGSKIIQSKNYAVIGTYCAMQQTLTGKLQLYQSNNALVSATTHLLMFGPDGNQIDRAALKIQNWRQSEHMGTIQIGKGSLQYFYKIVKNQQGAVRASKSSMKLSQQNKTEQGKIKGKQYLEIGSLAKSGYISSNQSVVLHEKIKELKLTVQDRQYLLNKLKMDRAQLISQVNQLFVRVKTLGQKADKKIQDVMNFFQGLINREKNQFRQEITYMMEELKDASDTIQHLTGIIQQSGIIPQKQVQQDKIKFKAQIQNDIAAHKFFKQKNQQLSGKLDTLIAKKVQSDQKFLGLYIFNHTIGIQKNNLNKKLQQLAAKNKVLNEGLQKFKLQKLKIGQKYESDEITIQVLTNQLKHKQALFAKTQKIYQQLIQRQKQQNETLRQNISQQYQVQKKMNQNISQLQNYLIQARDKVEQTESQYQYIQNRAVQQEEQIEYLKEQKMRILQQLQDRNMKLKQTKAKLQQVQDNYYQSQKHIKKIKQKTQIASHNSEESQKTIQRMNKHMKQLQTTYESSICKLREQLNTVNKPILVNHQNSQQFSRLSKENQYLQSEVNKLKNKLFEEGQKAKKTAFSLEVENKKLVIQFNRGLQQQKNIQNHFHKRIAKYKKQIAQLQEKCAKQQRCHKTDQQNLQNEAKKLKGKIRSLEQQVQQRNKQLIEAKRCIKELRSLNNNLQLVRLQLDRVKGQNKQLTHKLIKNNALDSFQNKINSFNSQLQVKNDYLRECKAELKQIRIENQSLVDQIKNYQSTRNQLSIENNRLSIENTHLSRLVQQLQIEKQFSSRRNQYLTSSGHQSIQQNNFSRKITFSRQNGSYQEKQLQSILTKALSQKNREIDELELKIEQANDELYSEKQSNAELLFEKRNLKLQNKALNQLISKLQQRIDEKQTDRARTPSQYSNIQHFAKMKRKNSQEDTQVKNFLFHHHNQQDILSPQTPKAQPYWKQQYEKLKKEIRQIDAEFQQQKRICTQKDKIMQKYQQQKNLLIKEIQKLKSKIRKQRQSAKVQKSRVQYQKYQQLKKMNKQVIQIQEKLKKSNQSCSISEIQSPKLKKPNLPSKIIMQESQNENQTQGRNSWRQEYNIQVSSPKHNYPTKFGNLHVQKLQQSQVNVSLESIVNQPKLKQNSSKNPIPITKAFQQSKVVVSVESPRAKQSKKIPQNIRMKICESQLNYSDKFTQNEAFQKQISKKSNQKTGKSDPTPAQQKLTVQNPNYLRSQRNYLQDYSQININAAKSFKLTQSNIFGLQ